MPKNVRNNKLPDEAKRRSIIKTIEIRLEGVREAINRAKIAFIIMTIASCAMLITVFNSYVSFTRKRAFEGSLKFRAIGVRDHSQFFSCLTYDKNNTCDSDETNKKFVEKINQDYGLNAINGCELIGQKLQVIDNELKNQLLSSPEVNPYIKQNADALEARRKLVLKPLLDQINNRILEDIEFYRFGESDKNDPDFNNLFLDKRYENKKDDPDKQYRGKEPENIKQVIKDKIYSPSIYAPSALSFYGEGVNHVNKHIMEKIFPQIEWDISFDEKSLPYSMYEQNKRAISEEWIENQNIRISLLGVNVNVDQFSLLGSGTIMMISFWMLFSQRRENRSIVTLLRDVREEVRRPKTPDQDFGKNEHKKDDYWDIANLAYHGIVHNLVFAQTGTHDRPISTHEIFRENEKDEYDVHEKKRNRNTAKLTSLIRRVATSFFFLPGGTILVILGFDLWTTTGILYPYYNNPAEMLIQRNINFPFQIGFEIVLGFLALLLTLSCCWGCYVFQKRTVDALQVFDDRLKAEEEYGLESESDVVTSPTENEKPELIEEEKNLNQ
jgi:hypothetical protein